MSKNETSPHQVLNLLEPPALVNAFISRLPEGFELVRINCGNRDLYGFIADFNLFTTTEGGMKNFYEKCRPFMPSFLKKFFVPKVLFVGTTVSEYALLPAGVETAELVKILLEEFYRTGLGFLIVKDMPFESPLLSEDENSVDSKIFARLEKEGFIALSGQALSYLPVDFSSTEDYLQRFSRSRRKDLKRKLRSLPELTIEELKTGDAFFDDANITLLYSLYLNVYEHSYIHFDKLSRDFFERVFRDKDSNGIIFVYKNGDRVIGFNLCFIFRGGLVDKYVGFVYPDAKEFNLYFVSWFHNLEFCIKNHIGTFIAGWTDPEIKAYLGARFTFTRHAVYIRNRFLRYCLGKIKGIFEGDKNIVGGLR